MRNYFPGNFSPENLRFGPDISSSNPSTSTNSAETSVQGAAGAGSPTLTAGGNVDYQSDGGAVSQAAISAVADVVKAALSGAGQVASQAGQVIAQQGQTQASTSSDNSALISQVLSDEQNLASYKGTDGGIQQSQTTNYVIWGAIGVAALAVLAFIFARK